MRMELPGQASGKQHLSRREGALRLLPWRGAGTELRRLVSKALVRAALASTTAKAEPAPALLPLPSSLLFPPLPRLPTMVAVQSPDVARITLHVPVPLWTHLYVLPFLFLYPLYLYAYYVAYDSWIKSEEWTFVYTVTLVVSHALAFLGTKWSIGFKAWVTTKQVKDLPSAKLVRVFPQAHKGEGMIVPLVVSRHEVAFTYQADKYILALPDIKAPEGSIYRARDITEPTFRRLPYPADSSPPLSHFQASRGLVSEDDAMATLATYGGNQFEIPKPSFT